MVSTNAITQVSERLFVGNLPPPASPNNSEVLLVRSDQATLTQVSVYNLTNDPAAQSAISFNTGFNGAAGHPGSVQLGLFNDLFSDAGRAGYFNIQTSAIGAFAGSGAGVNIWPALNTAKFNVSIGAGVTIPTPSLTIDINGGQYKGYNTNTAPPSGFLGERIVSSIPAGSAVSLSTGTPKTVTSITLTAGNWDISFVVAFGGGAITGTITSAGIATTTNSTTGWVEGDSTQRSSVMPTAATDVSFSLPAYRVSISGSTTYYLTVNSTFTVGTMNAYGRISGVRVG